MTYYRRTCEFTGEGLGDNGERYPFAQIPEEELLKWYRDRTKGFSEFHGIYHIEFGVGTMPNTLSVSYSYRNYDLEFDEGKMNASLLIDPDDDGNYPMNGMLLRGRIVTLGEREELA